MDKYFQGNTTREAKTDGGVRSSQAQRTGVKEYDAQNITMWRTFQGATNKYLGKCKKKTNPDIK